MSRPRQRRTAASLNEATGYVSKFKLVSTRPTISSRRSEFGGQAGMVQSGVGLGMAHVILPQSGLICFGRLMKKGR